jgi:hypothetical protein
MFLENSRYFNQPTINVKLKDGRTAIAVQPRILPSPTGAVATELKRNDRLDIIAFRQYQDGTRFWHIADANTLTDSRLLTEAPGGNSDAPPAPVIQVPQK